MYTREATGLGVIPLTTIGAVGGAIKSIIGDAHPKDAGRYAANERYYQQAMAGDQNALLALKGMSGRYGLIPKGTPPTGSSYCDCSGWATKETRDDAYAKYQAVISASGSTPSSQAGGGMFPAGPGTVAPPGGLTAGAFGGGMTLPLVAAGVALFVMTRPKGR